MPAENSIYHARRASHSRFLQVRGLTYHVREWPALQPRLGTLVMLHGWMDMSASFQFVVDALPEGWQVLAPDWRGFGLSNRPAADTYWFPDYLGDLDRLLDTLLPDEPANLVAHSMGGNVALIYAGVRPARVRRLVNLEGTGLRETDASRAPERYAQWLDELKAGARMADYADLSAVAERMRRNNPRLSLARSHYLAGHWAARKDDGRFELLGDPAHKLVNPVLYRLDEILACWRKVAADVLWVEAATTDAWHQFIRTPQFRQRLQALSSVREVVVADSGHMLHHDQPGRVAELIHDFMSQPATV